jgi:hypothetical protein
MSLFDESEVAILRDDDFTSLDNHFIRGLLFRSKTLTEEELRDSVDDSTTQPFAELKQRSWDFRFHLMPVSGNVKHVVRIESGESLREDLPAYFQCLLETSDGESFTVLSTEVPSEWLSSDRLDERVDGLGFFVGALAEPLGVGQRECLFIAKRFVWHPEQRTAIDLGSSVMELAMHGFDPAYLDVIRRMDRRRMSADEANAFESMFAAVERIAEQLTSDRTNRQEFATASQFTNLIELFRRPLGRAGDLIEISGRAVKVVPVFDETARSEQTPLYYQVDLSAPIGNKKISLKNPDGTSLIFENQFPVTLAVPAALVDPQSLKGSRVVARGYMYRFWNYDSVYAEVNNVRGGQYSPLVFVATLDEVRTPPDGTAWVLHALLLGLIAFVIGLGAFIARGDRRERTRRRQQRIPERIPWEGADDRDAS